MVKKNKMIDNHSLKSKSGMHTLQISNTSLSPVFRVVPHRKDHCHRCYLNDIYFQV